MTPAMLFIAEIERARDMLAVIKIAAEQIATGELEDDVGPAAGIGAIADQTQRLLCEAIMDFEETSKPTLTAAA